MEGGGGAGKSVWERGWGKARAAGGCGGEDGWAGVYVGGGKGESQAVVCV